MATPSTIRLDPNVSPAFSVPHIASESAERASTVLQKNHELHHVYFNDDGFHNHIVHHILATLALGADAQTLQKHYDDNAIYQQPPPTLDVAVTNKLDDLSTFMSSLGERKNYNNFMTFFSRELDNSSVPDVLNKYMFKGDERAKSIFSRMFSGFLHPIIHLGYGIEFDQPAIVAEALAQACTHDVWIDQLFSLTEKRLDDDPPPADTFVNIVDKIRNDEKLHEAAHWDDGNKIRDGILARAKDEMASYAAQWQVVPDKLDEAVAEMIAGCAYFTGAAQRPPKQIKFDFYFMHAINCSIFFTSLMKQTWIDTANKVKLLEYKGRVDLALYASRRSPKLHLEDIEQYPVDGKLQSWDTIIDRAKIYKDDGHTSKFIRALAHGQEVCKPYESSGKFRINGDMWQRLAQMVMDSVEDSGNRWVRSAGFDEAWENYKDRSLTA